MLLYEIINKLRLKDEREEYSVIHDVIEKGIYFKATNLWILIFAIFIASVGLNVNSTAVIIGAMLISPLMGPILGIGYSIATYDFIMLRKSISNYTFAVVASLITSTFYFLISPLNEAHSELLSRTSPSIYDVLIAFFGGLAGIVAISSKLKGNVIPGVAIATALMPPLCTAGFGLATANWNFLFGALYLFTINSVFIALATFVTSRFIKIPITNQSTEKEKIRANRWVTAIVVITLVPSFYFGYQLIKKDKFIRDSNLFINNNTFVESGFLVKNEIDYSKKEIKLIYGGRPLNNVQRDHIRSKLKDFKLDDVELIFQQGFSLDDPDIKTNQLLQNEINTYKFKVDSLQKINQKGLELYNEIKPLFTEISACLYSQSKLYSNSSANSVDIVIIFSNNSEKTKSEKDKISNWLKAKLKTPKVLLLIENNLKE